MAIKTTNTIPIMKKKNIYNNRNTENNNNNNRANKSKPLFSSHSPSCYHLTLTPVGWKTTEPSYLPQPFFPWLNFPFLGLKQEKIIPLKSINLSISGASTKDSTLPQSSFSFNLKRPFCEASGRVPAHFLTSHNRF